MFRKLKQINSARHNRKKLYKNIEELRMEDMFDQQVEIRSEERLLKLEKGENLYISDSDPQIPFLSYRTDRSTKIPVSQTKRYKKHIPVRVGVA